MKSRLLSIAGFILLTLCFCMFLFACDTENNPAEVIDSPSPPETIEPIIPAPPVSNPLVSNPLVSDLSVSDPADSPPSSSDPDSEDTITFGGCFYRDYTHWDDVEYGQLVDYFYVMPIFQDVWEYSWNDVSEIKADDLLLTCYFSNFIHWQKDFEGMFIEKTAPADIVEWSIQQYFDVDSEYLRTSSFYNPEDHTYTLMGGFGSGGATATIRGEQRGTRLSVEIGFLSDYSPWERELLPGETLIKIEGYPDQILTPKGVLTLELVYGKKARYISYERYE